MLARGIRSYHRPGRIDEALRLAAQGVTPLAGGTRLLAREADVPNVLDLAALDLAGVRVEDGDLVLGALVTLQDVIDSPLSWGATAGLLPLACRSHSASPLIRGMATLGGEAIHAAPDSDVAAALLALNAVFVVAGPEEPLEIPALRFLKGAREDLAGGGLLTSIVVPGAPDGAALERVAVLPSAPSLFSVAAAVAFSGETVGRARLAFTGLSGPPARVPEAETRLEGGAGDEASLERCVDQALKRLSFRDDAHAPAAYRRRVARPMTLRALRLALARARARKPGEAPRPRAPRPHHTPTPTLPYFTSGRIDVNVNGDARRPSAEARTTLLELLRREGYWGVKHGCETGECGACAVLLDGRPVSACMTLALRAQGRSVLTVEGLGSAERLHPIQSAFVETGAIQCGFCTPAMELCAKSLLDAIPDPSEAEVRDALAGCLCRCTGYVKPVEAVLRAARQLRDSR
jgi:aerobic-type carbon monoxide dehydrogenase small subunit (CoxS/CutS family)/CO/xanthine dehydrogenase FAD-binding subunit